MDDVIFHCSTFNICCVKTHRLSSSSLVLCEKCAAMCNHQRANWGRTPSPLLAKWPKCIPSVNLPSLSIPKASVHGAHTLYQLNYQCQNHYILTVLLYINWRNFFAQESHRPSALLLKWYYSVSQTIFFRGHSRGFVKNQHCVVFPCEPNWKK